MASKGYAYKQGVCGGTSIKSVSDVRASFLPGISKKILDEIDLMDVDLPKIMPTKKYADKPMSLDEANMHLHISNKPFIVFLNSDSNKVTVIYKRDDGHHGLVEPKY